MIPANMAMMVRGLLGSGLLMGVISAFGKPFPAGLQAGVCKCNGGIVQQAGVGIHWAKDLIGEVFPPAIERVSVKLELPSEVFTMY